jgi:hypothetical protein
MLTKKKKNYNQNIISILAISIYFKKTQDNEMGGRIITIQLDNASVQYLCPKSKAGK